MHFPDSTEVLIVGAGPVGLALALELGSRGIQCLVVEKRDGSIHVPKMTVVSTRNMEICRRWGIADEVRNTVWDPDRQLDFVYVETLKGTELARVLFGLTPADSGEIQLNGRPVSIRSPPASGRAGCVASLTRRCRASRSARVLGRVMLV